MNQAAGSSLVGRSVFLPTERLFSRPLLAAGLALSLCACGASGERPARTGRRVSLLAELSASNPFASPARFHYHPRERAATRAELTLATGELLLVGERGERWLFDARAHTLSAGAMLAPETLVAALPSADGFWFVGQSGTSYAAPGALAVFERSSVPAHSLNAVSAAGSAIVGVTSERSLARSGDFGATWSAVGPAGTNFIDAALTASGAGVALAVPEALFRTSDFGASWQPLVGTSLGALELDVDRTGRVEVMTALGDRIWNRESGVLGPRSLATPGVVLPASPRGPDALALSEGRAAIVGNRYQEVTRVPERRGWQLLLGELEEGLKLSALPEADGCRVLRFAAFGDWSMFACFRGAAENASQPIELYRRDGLGKSFSRLQGRLDGSPSSFRLALGAEGRFLVTGVCAPGASAAGCSPSGIQYGPAALPPRTEGGSKTTPRSVTAYAAAAAPSLAEPALELAFSTDGRLAYAVGRRTKTGRFAIFVARDGGKTFEAEDLNLGQMATDDGDDEFVERSPGTRVESLNAAEDGTVAITFVHYTRRTLVVTDERGKLLSAAEPPVERALLSASGLRALAVVVKSRQVWESLNGGVSWEPSAPLPVDLCRDEACDLALRCTPHACALGRELTRVGWGGAPVEQSVLAPAPRSPRRSAEQKLLVPLVCTLEVAPFRALAGVQEAPNAHDAALGGVDWYATAEDTLRGSVTVHRAKQGLVEPQVLLGPLARPEEYALAVLGQVEGVAALRYRTADTAAGRTHLTQVEVAWDNVLDGRRAVARLADAGAYAPGDYVAGTGRVQRAQPDLVSIASGGVYLRLHQAARSDQTTLFLDGKRVDKVSAVPWPRDERVPARPELVRVANRDVPVLMVGRGAAVVRANPSGAGWAFQAFTTGMIDPAAFGLTQFVNIAYAGARAGLYVEVQNALASNDSALLFPFRADGAVLDPPIRVPTQRSLGETPEPCDPERRANSPRIVAAAAAGTQRPVLVNDAAEGPRTLLTDAAVLYGTPEAACASAFDAIAVAAEPAQAARERALILLDDLEHSVLFRVAGERESSRIEYRGMACRFDPNAEIPPEVYRAGSR